MFLVFTSVVLFNWKKMFILLENKNCLYFWKVIITIQLSFICVLQKVTCLIPTAVKKTPTTRPCVGLIGLSKLSTLQYKRVSICSKYKTVCMLSLVYLPDVA